MGFYFDLESIPGVGFREVRVPTVFWALFALAGFALVCMGAASFTILKALLETGSLVDRALILGYWVAVLGFLGVGIRLALIRKFVDTANDALTFGYRFGRWKLFSRALDRSAITEITIIHSSPGPNTAPTLHRETRYYLKGHYRLIAKTNSGRVWTLDRNIDEESLTPLNQDLNFWLSPMVNS